MGQENCKYLGIVLIQTYLYCVCHYIVSLCQGMQMLYFKYETCHIWTSLVHIFVSEYLALNSFSLILCVAFFTPQFKESTFDVKQK